jgi:enoyl-[acyl-carrier-protein] reductase (NADH)
MAINTNPYQNIYTTSGAGNGGIGTSTTYYEVNITNPISHRMFSTPIAENNHYRTDDVTVDMLTKLQVYTNSILAGDIKTINEDYIFAMQTVAHILKRAKTRVDEKTIENIWAKATALDGNVVENYTRELLYVMGLNR